MAHRRILLKLSGEMLGGRGRGVDNESLTSVAHLIDAGRRMGVQLGVVLGAGNLVRGAGPNRTGLEIDRQAVDGMGMLATCINATALCARFGALGVETQHYSGLPGIPRAIPFDPDTADRLLDRGGIAVFSGGTGLPFFSTDTAAAVRALQIRADALYK